MTQQLHERDAMVCRSCGKEERASEGYPCENCGTFICQICEMRGITLCKRCADDASAFGAPTMPAPAAEEVKDKPATSDYPTWLHE